MGVAVFYSVQSLNSSWLAAWSSTVVQSLRPLLGLYIVGIVEFYSGAIFAFLLVGRNIVGVMEFYSGQSSHSSWLALQSSTVDNLHIPHGWSGHCGRRGALQWAIFT